MLAAMSFLTFGQKWTALSSDKPVQPQVKLISSSEEQIVVNFSLGGFNTIRVETPNGTQNIISVPKMASTLIAGAPDLPQIVFYVDYALNFELVHHSKTSKAIKSI